MDAMQWICTVRVINKVLKNVAELSRKTPMRNALTLGLCLLLLPALCQAWWNDDWDSRRQVAVDAAATGADIQETLSDVPVLVRLHAGNFGYFAELAENGRDLRFLKDDKTPLVYDVEQIDVLSEIGLVWVKLPQLRGGVSSDDFWLYYGNANAPDGSDPKNLYDVAQGLVYHFKDGEAPPQDATAYGSHAADSKASVQAGGWIGAAAQFTGAGPLLVNPAPQLAIAADQGWTFSTWLKIDQPQNGASLLDAHEGGNGIDLSIQGAALSARWSGPGGAVTTSTVNLTLGKWQHVAVTVKADKLELYVDGMLVGNAAITLTAVNPAIAIGRNLVGLLDEIQIAATARSADWLKLSFRSQSPDFSVLSYGQDETNSSGDGHFMVIVRNVTLDGWVVIGLTLIMLVVAVVVMVGKTLVINRISKDNRAFLEKYRQLDPNKLSTLDQEETAEDRELADSDLLTALVGKHDHFQSSTLYHLYHTAIQELNKLQGGDGQVVIREAWDYLRVKLDSQVVMESQRLNRNMVLLTIAIAGGPFLGLLGTVVGVMITFAAIAASGDVNINAIAPGIAAALLATVAGLAVAIPALFAYNYLLTQIKDITASMRVFSDEFLAVLAMRAAQQQRGA
jgi:biopolymer transport protein ExbB